MGVHTDAAVDAAHSEGDSGSMADSPKLLIVGDGPVADALTEIVSVLGWPIAVTSGAAAIGSDVDAVVVTSHHEDVDGPTICAALAGGTAYVGAMGSRRTQARRREWLLANGVTEDVLTAVHAPIGLDIGADRPGEIAVSILAEVIAVRSGRPGLRSVGDREGPIHPELAEGEAYCPGG